MSSEEEDFQKDLEEEQTNYKSNNEFIEDDDENEEENEDEESYEDEFENVRKKKKTSSRKKRGNIFVDTEADVDEGDDDEEEGEDDFLGEDDFIDEKDVDYETAHPPVSLAPRTDYSTIDPEKEAARLASLYGGRRRAPHAETEIIPRQLLVPTAKDPRIWIVKCSPGKERTLILTAMKKIFSLGNTSVISIACRDHLKGYLYVEARALGDVSMVLSGIPGIFASRISLLPMNEMVDVLNNAPKTNSLLSSNRKPGSWARLKRGKYAGDIVQIADYPDSSDNIRIWIVPRIDLSAVTKQKQQKNESEKKERPPAKLFNPKEVAAAGGSISKSANYWHFNGESYTTSGLLEKDIKLSAIEDVSNPTLEEVSVFNSVSESFSDSSSDPAALFESAASSAVASQKISYRKGESVAVIEGDLTGLKGTIKNIMSDGSVEVTLINGKSALFFPNQLTKSFSIGDYVKVVSGKHVGLAGLVTNVDEDNVISMLADASLSEIKVLSRDVVNGKSDQKEAIQQKKQSTPSNKSTDHDLFSFCPFTVHDLVKFSSGTGYAIVIKVINRSSVVLLDSFGSEMNANTNSLQPIKSALCVLDSFGNNVKLKDSVEILEGDHARKIGAVLQIFRNNLFIKCAKTGNVLVAKSSNVGLMGGSRSLKTSMSGIAEASFSPAFQRRDPDIGKTVKITHGPHKGYMGILKDVTATGGRVELHTGSKMIVVPRNTIQLVTSSPIRKTTSEGGWGSTDWGTSFSAKTPVWNSENSSRTPAWNAEGSSRTPAWNADSSSKTPTWNSDSSSRTPAWNSESSSRTPSWNTADSSKTPVWSSENSSSSKTPVWNAESSANSASKWNSSSGNEGNSSWHKQQQEPQWNISNDPTTENHRLMIPGLFVKIPNSSSNEGIVKESLTSFDKISVALSNGTTRYYAESELEPVTPQLKDNVVILRGDFKDMTGILEVLNGDDAVVQFEDENIQVVPLKDLGKFQK